MRLALSRAAEALASSFWFMQGLMTLGAVLLAWVIVHLDQRVVNENLRGLWWVYAGGAEGARAVLSTVAGLMITVAGTTFSITIAVLTLASSQFGPRLLGNFMRDRGNQVVLGAFVSTFVYCLLVLRTVRGGEDAVLVPHLAVTIGVLMTLLDLVALIYFIHHVAVSIQAPQVVARSGRELDATIERLFPAHVVRDRSPAKEPVLPPEAEWKPLPAGRSGYLQGVDTGLLTHLAASGRLLWPSSLGPCARAPVYATKSAHYWGAVGEQ